MKKHLLVAWIAALLAAPAFAQYGSDSLAKEEAYRKNLAAKFEHWIPKGWVVESAAEGDLNSDGIPDAALVISDMDIHNPSDDSFDRPLHSKIMIFMNEGHGYSHFLQSANYVDDRHNTPRGRPGAELEINKGVLSIWIGTPALRWSIQYLFRMEGDRFRMIGAEYADINTFTGIAVVKSYNLLTGKCHEKVEFIFDDDSQKKETLREQNLKEGTVWGRIKGNKKVYFGENFDAPECR